MKKVSIVVIMLIFLFPSSLSANNSSIVNPNQMYTYDIMTNDIKNQAEKYPEIFFCKSIGKTNYGREIWAIKLGKGKANVFINASHHAREWLTTNLIMNMVEEYAKAYENNMEIENYNVKDLLDKVSIWFIPMVNPDGVTLQQNGLSAFSKEIHKSLVEMNNGSYDFKKWKANADGVDLNRQYPAEWENITDVSYIPAFKNYKGESPLQTIENSSLVDFTYEIDPEISVAYHSSGRIIYWFFHNQKENIERDRDIAIKIAKVADYELVKPRSNPSGGGYTDWFIQEFKRPAYTIEIGKHVYERELPLSSYPEAWKRNKSIGLLIAEEGYKLYKKRVNIILNNKSIHYDIQPVLIRGTYLVPLNLIAKAFEVKVGRNLNTNSIEIVNNDNLIIMPLESNFAITNGQQIELNVPATIINGMEMVPIRFVAESLGKEVAWEGETKTILIKDPIENDPIEVPADDLLDTQE